MRGFAERYICICNIHTCMYMNISKLSLIFLLLIEPPDILAQVRRVSLHGNSSYRVLIRLYTAENKYKILQELL